MSSPAPAPLSREDKNKVFGLATRSLVHRYGKHFESGMSDEELLAALEQCLSTYGGSCGPQHLSVFFTGSGLRIWGGWHIVNHIKEAPLFSGKATIAMSREFYGIANPGHKQLGLL